MALAVFALWWPAAPAFAQSDADFLAAKATFEKGDRNRLAAMAPKLSGHVLAPYVEYWQLKLGIDEASPQAIRSYLDRYPNTPLADRLRVDWLKLLAKQGLWSRFAEDYPPPATDDVELACWGVLYRWQRDGDSALAAAIPLWFTGSSTPDACDPAFAALIRSGELTLADRRARFRLANEAGNLKTAQALGAALPGKDRVADRDYTAVTRNPLRALESGKFTWSTGGGRELALLALERAARSDAGAARPAWVTWRDRLPEADRDYGNARLAYHAARQLNAAANEWFGEAGAAKLSDDAAAWRVRAALRVQAWDDVLAAIDALSDAQRQDAAWRYWRARALAARGRKDEADALLVALAPEAHFYGVLAGEALGRRFAVPASRPLTPPAAELAVFAERPEVRRAVKLAALDMRRDSRREWYYIVRDLGDDALLLAADHARRVGMYDRAINTAERTQGRHDYALRYLAPFRGEFETAAKTQDVDVAMLYGIARQESRFAADIVSSAGAVGLMQLMPGTARWVAKQLGRGDYRQALIADAELNTQFGAFYFKYWLQRLDDMPALAAAAYNAGPGRAQAWRPPRPLEGAIWVETIPFNETRDYVKRVLANAMIYAQTFDTDTRSLTDRLGVVTPRNSTVVSAAALPGQ
ncbi:MAG: lytic transglycosylase domain-containing protein [Burkholderiales bacterium]|nr:lytic transglycosylase domain-containing protein [Burkholderiales bacterium]